MNIIDIIKKMNDEKRHLALIYLFIAIIIAIGIILKLKAYFYNQSLFHDECALAVNILDKNYLELFKPLDIVHDGRGDFFLLCVPDPAVSFPVRRADKGRFWVPLQGKG